MARRDAATPLPQQRSAFEANLMHADWFASRGQTAQAVALYRTAATNAENGGQYAVAVTAYASVARLEGAGSSATIKVGEMRLRMGQREEAAEVFGTAGQECMASGAWREGLRAFRMAAKAQPDAARWLRLVDWCRHLKQRNEELQYLEEGAADLFANHDLDGFVAVAKRMLAEMPGHVPTLRRLIRAHFGRRDLHRAVESIAALLRARPGDVDALERMAEAFAMLGKKLQAAEVMRRLAERLVHGGPDDQLEAERLIGRGLSWCPNDRRLAQLLRRRQGAGTAAHVVVSARTPALDLSDFVEAVPEGYGGPEVIELAVDELDEIDASGVYGSGMYMAAGPA